MLIEFRVKNFRSIKTEQVLSMVASRDNSLPSNVIDTGLRMGGAPLRLLRSVVIYGANASGKSNLIKALNAFRLVVLNSATKLNDGELIPLVVPYLLNLESAQQASTFEVVVLVADQIYRYGCSVGGAAVSREYLFIRKSIPGSRETLVFERNEPNAATTVFGASFNGDKNLIQQHTRDNCLILSRMAQDNMKQAQPLFRWFRTQLGAIDMAEQSGRYISEGLYRTAKKDIDLESMAGLVSVADETISRVHAELREEKVSEKVQGLMKFAGLDVPEQIEVAKVRFGRRLEDSSDTAYFDMEEEANGTKRFFALTNFLLDAVRDDKTLAIDELDCSLHPMLIKEILEVIHHPSLSDTNPQYLLATHDTNLMDLEQLRRDQIVLVEKGPSGSTEVYTLWDFEEKPRKDAVLANRYLAGNYGGVPRLGNLRRAILNALQEKSVQEVPSEPAIQ